MIRSVSIIGILLCCVTPGALAGRSEFNFALAGPESKHPVEVTLRRNPFQVTAEPDRPLPVLRDRDDPAMKLPALLQNRIRSVIRSPRPLLLIEGRVYQPGDELRIAGGGLLPHYRIHLKAVEAERVIFHLTSLDPKQPGQVEAFVPLASAMRDFR